MTDPIAISTHEAFQSYRSVIEGQVSVARSIVRDDISIKVRGWRGPKGESLLSFESKRQLREMAKDIMWLLGEDEPHLRVVK